MTKKTLEKLTDNARDILEGYKRDLKKYDGNGQETYYQYTRYKVLGFLEGLQVAGVITEEERRVLYTYATLQEVWYDYTD